MRTWDHVCINSRVDVNALCAEGALGLGVHVVIGVVLGFTTQTQYQVWSSFLLDVAVHGVVRLYFVIVNSYRTKLLHTFASRKRVI